MDLLLLDAALTYFYERRNEEYDFDFYSFERHYFGDNLPTLSPDILLNKLVKDGLLLVNSIDVSLLKVVSVDRSEKLRISYDGIIFHDSGGYTEIQRRNQADREFEEKKRKLEIDQIDSTILTNKNVRQINNLQRFLIAAATIMSGISLYISWKTYKKDDRDIINVSPQKVIVIQRTDTLPKETQHQTTLKSQQP